MTDFHETSNAYPNLNTLNIPRNDLQHFTLNKTNEIKDYFVGQIKDR